jgi:hypothetical protein
LPGNVVPGELHPGSAGDIALDGGADVGHGLVREGVHFVLLHFDDAHDIIPFDDDFVGSTVFNDNFAVLIFVDAD